MYHYGLILIVLVEEAVTLCEITDRGNSREETYTDSNDCERYYNFRIGGYMTRNCKQKTRTIMTGPTTFSCVTSTIQEMYSSNNNQDTENHFIIKNSSLDSLVGDGKTWPRLTELTLDNCNISSMIPGFFNGFTELSYLEIKNNHILDIVDGVFSSLKNLEKLILCQNSILRLGPHAFLGASNVNLLDLSKNKIEILPESLFFALNSSIKVLDLSENSLISLENNLNLPGLKNLSIEKNNINEFDFSHVTNLTLNSLNLSQNNISKIINLDSFEADIVTLSFNLIEYIEKLGKIRTFNIRNNHLTALNKNFVSEFVEALDLSFNFITDISPEAFAKGSVLKILHLQNNHLTILPNNCFENLEVLEYLDLSYNNIFNLEFGTFNNLRNLESLKLSQNKGMIDVHSFLRLSRLKVLEIENNNLKNFDPFFFESHTNLKKITIGENSWSCNELTKIIHLMESKNITLTKGHVIQSSNIHGIACNSGSKNNLYNSKETLDSTTLPEIQIRFMPETFDDEGNNSNNIDYFRDVADKILNILNSTNLKPNKDESLNYNNGSLLEKLTETITKGDNKSTHVFVSLILVIMLLLFMLVSLAIMIIHLKKLNLRVYKEEVELIG